MARIVCRLCGDIVLPEDYPGRTSHLRLGHGMRVYKGVVRENFLHPWDEDSGMKRCDERDIPKAFVGHRGCRACEGKINKQGGRYTPYRCTECGRVEGLWDEGDWWVAPAPVTEVVAQ